MKTIHKILTSFVKRHPFLSCLLCAEFAFLATCEFMFHAFGELPLYRSDPDVAWGYGIIIGITVFMLLFDFLYLKPKAILSLLVGGAMLASTTHGAEIPIEEHPALIVGVVGVVAVGGWIWWKSFKCANKAAKGRTNNWPEELVAQPEWGAAFSWAEEGYCHQELSSKTPTVFTIQIIVNSASNATITASADVGEQFTQTFSEAVNELAGHHGLYVADHIGTMESFERNRQPVVAEEVPVKFDFSTRTMTLGSGGILVTVERSHDLEHWESFARFNVGEGAQLILQDVSEDNATFWRVVAKEPW